ncbi:MAG: VOC family protein [Betaproteobacteria bacterium]|nr:VOC family protein [Betaproteobacteria bacterium]
MTNVAREQVPAAGELSLDHVAHFVPHVEAASASLEKLGFTATPFSAHSHRLEPGGPLTPAGAGNVCVMLERGYLEIVTPTADTPLATQLRTAIRRHVGVHMIAFGTAAPEADHARLEKAGYAPLPPVALQREIGTVNGTGLVRFTVVRTAPGSMPEGRIQFCLHHTPELLWQARWIEHANRATGLTAVILCVEDPQEAAQRYARYTGLLAQRSGSVWRLTTARGCLLFIDEKTLLRRLDLAPPALPWIAGYVLESADIDATGDYLRRCDAGVRLLGGRRLLVNLPAALGGIVVFEPQRASVLDFN